MYPGPYNGSYATPWLWVDGRQRGYIYSQWPNYVSQQLGVPTPVAMTLDGDYNPGTRAGTVRAVIQNDSTAEITARVSVVITEDSCYYVGPNGDPWHNHVCRDYIPDQNGTIVTIPAGAADTVEQPFTLQSGWNQAKCKLVVYAQSTTMVPSDSSYPAFQGAAANVLDFVGVSDPGLPALVRPTLQSGPNPCRGHAELSFAAPAGLRYALDVFSPDGRLAWNYAGTTTTGTNRVIWSEPARGIYLCRL
ncbi:MAG: Omp28-related outer membrane protein, partial [candidate division WOR-3 bacterium]